MDDPIQPSQPPPVPSDDQSDPYTKQNSLTAINPDMVRRESHPMADSSPWSSVIDKDIKVLSDFKQNLVHFNEQFNAQSELYREEINKPESGSGGISLSNSLISMTSSSLHLVILMGSMNVGKSTLINLLLREIFTPISTQKRTSAVVSFRYSHKVSVRISDFRDETGRQLLGPDKDGTLIPKPIITEECDFDDTNHLKRYIGEMVTGKHTSERLVEVLFPFQALKPGITLVDCPGYDENSDVESSIRDVLHRHKSDGDLAATCSLIYLCRSDGGNFRTLDANFVSTITESLGIPQVLVVVNAIDRYLEAIQDEPGRSEVLTDDEKERILTELEGDFVSTLSRYKKSWNAKVFLLSGKQEMNKLLAYEELRKNELRGGNEERQPFTLQYDDIKLFLPSPRFVHFEKKLGELIQTQAKDMLVLECRRLSNEASRMMIHMRCLPDIRLSPDGELAVDFSKIQDSLLDFENRFIKKFTTICNTRITTILDSVRSDICNARESPRELQAYLYENSIIRTQSAVTKKMVHQGLRQYIAENNAERIGKGLQYQMEVCKQQALREILDEQQRALRHQRSKAQDNRDSNTFLRFMGAKIALSNPRMVLFFQVTVQSSEVSMLVEQAQAVLERQRKTLRTSIGAVSGLVAIVPAMVLFLVAGVLTGGVSIVATGLIAAVGSAAFGGGGGLLFDRNKQRENDVIEITNDANIVAEFDRLTVSTMLSTSFLDAVLRDIKKKTIESHHKLGEQLRGHITAAFPTGIVRKGRHECEDGFLQFGATFAGVALWCEAIAFALQPRGDIREEMNYFEIVKVLPELFDAQVAAKGIVEAGGEVKAVIPYGDVVIKTKKVSVLDNRDIVKIFWEYTLMKYLQHEHIITPVGMVIIDEKGLIAIMMEKKDFDLRAALAKKLLSPLQRYNCALAMADALSFIHSAGCIHRDVNPANILLSGIAEAGDNIKCFLADFDIAVPVNHAITVAGTRGYCAPEVGQGVVLPSADVYSFGIVLYVLAKGDEPSLLVSGQAYVAEEYLTRDMTISEPLKKLLLRMTAAFPNARISMSEVIEILTAMDWHDFFGTYILNMETDNIDVGVLT